MLDEKDLEMIERRLDMKYVLKAECDTNKDDIWKRVNSDNVRLAVIENQLKLITWILSAVAGGIITMLIKLFFGS